MHQRQKEPITDWDKAYHNGGAVGLDVVDAYVERWTQQAKTFRDQMTRLGRARLDQAYGEAARQRYDLFLPDKTPADGLAIFVHGGYWKAFDKSFWSHLASGALDHGFAVAMPSYTLCPEVRISNITKEIATFLTKVANDIDGPIHLAGHSAGGHLVTSSVLDRASSVLDRASDALDRASDALDRGLADRIARIVSISGVHDLRPLLKTEMNETLRLDLAEARAESPVLLEPIDGVDLTCWVGADELPAFLEQNALLADIWHGLGAKTEIVEAPGKHHFSVIEDLVDPSSALTNRLLGKG